MKHDQTFILPKGSKKLIDDIHRLQHIGSITSLEIDLDPMIPLLDDLILYCRGTGGLFYFQDSIFVNYSEIGEHGLDKLIRQIFYFSGSAKTIVSILVHMSTKMRNQDFVFTVEVDLMSSLPKMISISDPTFHFEFMHIFQTMWLTIPR